MSDTYGILHPVKRVVASQLDRYEAPKRWEICGVPVVFKPATGGTSATTWKETLEEWLPKYYEVGWLDGLNKIHIGEGVPGGDAVGRYFDHGTIKLENEIMGDLLVVLGGRRETVLTHEIIHHAHVTLNDFEGSRKAPNKEALLKEQVSYYAGTNVGEAIAEIGTGIAHGHDFEPWVHDYYARKEGPQGVYDIG